MINVIVALCGVILLLIGIIAWCATIIKWQNKQIAFYGELRPPELVIDEEVAAYGVSK